MPRSGSRHRSRARSRRKIRDYSRDRSSCGSTSRNESRRNSRQTHRSRSPTREHRHNSRLRESRSSSHCYRRHNGDVQNTLDTILKRLNAIESDKTLPCALSNNTPQNCVDPVGEKLIANSSNAINVITHASHQNTCPSELSSRAADERVINDVRHRPRVEDVSLSDKNVRNCEPSASNLIEAIKSLQPSRFNNYYVSDFDPSINTIDAWCSEVDRARDANGWSDYECLSRVASCLKGDARVWLSEWVTNDRTWSNFKREFKPLCPQRLDYANILYNTMNVTSDKYPTFAEYARRTLLKLRVVQGLSDELRVLIVIRGIDSPQVRAAAANAQLTVDNLVSFLSIYVKPARGKHESRVSNLPAKRPFPYSKQSEARCFLCGMKGHFGRHCKRTNSTTNSGPTSSQNDRIQCSFCKKPGHTEGYCFAKSRSGMRNQRNVNLCKYHCDSRSRDVMTAVVEGIPMDVLIDSGALNVSLISSDVVRYLSCQPKQTYCVLKGISDREVIATSFVTTTIELRDISIEADLVVVPSSCMNTPIVIGTDILNRDGVVYIRTKDRQYLARSVSDRCINKVHTRESLKIDTPLRGESYDALVKVINEHSDFFISGTATTTVSAGEMDIKLTSVEPVAYRPYKLSHQEKLKVRAIVSDLLDKGIIKESQSEYASPIILVKKKDGSDRMCVDFRALNRLIVRDRYPLPLIDDHIDRLGNYTYFSSLDMATGFHQIPINKHCTHYTGFVTPEGHYEYLKMPFGLCNSPIVYQRIINGTLRKFIDAGRVLVYIDDVLIMSSSITEGISLLRDVLHTLTQSGFSINLLKCSFLKTEVEYLGRVVSKGQVRPSPRKIEALTQSPIPQNIKQVRQLLGLAGYFRKYVKDYATKTASLSCLTKKGVAFNWGPEQAKVRADLIHVLTNAPVLAIFDPKLQTEVHTDASSAGYGAILLQIHTDKSRHVVEYFSKVTHNAEAKYHSYELETLAVVKALQHFRHYLIGIRFKLVTDCNAIKSTERKKDLLPRVARWWLYLQDFDFHIEYRQGSMMPHVDYLSRNPPVLVNQISRPRNWAQIAQSADDEVQGLLIQLQEGRLDTSRYMARDGLLYYKYSPVGEESRLLCFIPKGHRLSLLRMFHDEHQHINVEKTVDLILKHFWFPGIRQFVKKYIAHCVTCVSKKRIPRQPLQTLISWQKPSAPFETIHIDVLGPIPMSEGYKFILLVVDAFTKFSLLYPIRRQDTSELKRCLTNAVSLFDAPKLMVSDRGRMFESVEFSRWVKEQGADIHYITPEMHQSNGQAERYMRTLLNMLRIEVTVNTVWSKTLWKLQLILNVTRQKTTQTSPLNLLIGIDVVTPLIRSVIRDTAIDNAKPDRETWREICRARASELLAENQKRQDDRANQHRRPPRQFKIDDFVFVIKFSQSIGKLDSGMRGPYKVVKVLPAGRYELKLLSGGYGKTTQAAAQYMVPWKGEWCPETCSSFFDLTDDEETNKDPVSPVTGSSQAPSMPLLEPQLCDAEMTVEEETQHQTIVEDDSTSGEAV